MSGTKSVLERFEERMRILEDQDLRNLHLKFMGLELGVRTIGLIDFNILDPKSVPAKCDKVASIQKFDQFFQLDWQQSEEVLWSNYLSSAINSTLGMNITCEMTEAKNGKDYYVIGLENEPNSRQDSNMILEPLGSSKSLSERSTAKSLSAPLHQKPKRLLELSFEESLLSNQVHKTCVWEFLKIYLPDLYKLVLAAFVSRSAELDAENLGADFKQYFQELQVTGKLFIKIEELLNIKLVKCYKSKDVISEKGIFHNKVILPNRFHNYQQFLTKYARKDDFERGQIWQLVTNLTRLTTISATEPQQRNPSRKAIQFAFEHDKVREVVGWVEVVHLGGERGIPTKNFLKTLLFFAMFFAEGCKCLIRWLEKHNVECRQPKEFESPLPSLNTSGFFNASENQLNHSKQVMLDALSGISADIQRFFSIIISENTLTEQEHSVFQRSWAEELLDNIQITSSDFVGRIRAQFISVLPPTTAELQVKQIFNPTQNEEILHSLPVTIRTIKIYPTTDDSKDQKIFFKDIKVTRLQPDPSLNWDQELQLKTNIAVFFALEGWCDSLQQLIALKLSKSLLVEAVQRQISEPQPKVGVSPQLSTVRPRTYDEADFENGIFKTAMVTGLQPRKIVVEDAVNSLRKYLGEDQHLKEVASAIFTKLIEETTYKSKSQLLNFDEALEKYLRQSTEKEFDFILAEEQSTQVNLQVIDQNTKQLFWSAVLIKPADWSEDRLNKGYRRFKNLLSCRLLKKNNFEPIALIEGIRNVD